MKKNPGALRWFIWSLASFFYFYEYLLRVSTSVMVPELMHAFKVDAAALGLMSAFYFYAYAPMQIPVGILIDRFGAKKLLSLASLVCGAGIIVFGISYAVWEACAGRFLMGLGSSIAFVAMVFVCTHWFEKSKRALLVGLANSIGMLGAICGQGPLSLSIKALGWRVTSLALGVIGFLLAIIIYLIIGRRKPTPVALEKRESQESLGSALKQLCKSGHSWLNAVIALFFYMTTTAVGGLWGVPFIQKTYHVSKHTAGFATSMLFFGWLIGGPIMGFLSDKIKNRKHIILITIFLTLASLLCVVYLTKMPIFLVYVFMFLVGFFSSGQLLNFTLAAEINSPNIKGTSIAFTNFVVAVGSSIVQPIIGVFLDSGWDGKITNGINVYSIKDFQNAFLILPIMLAVAGLLTFFLKEQPPIIEAGETLSGD